MKQMWNKVVYSTLVRGNKSKNREKMNDCNVPRFLIDIYTIL